jgi:cytidylate kinase
VRTFLNGTDVSYELRQESTAGLASELASLAPLRQQLLTLQRDFRRPPGLVADGRDMGTVVFPDAELKIYLTASAECRAERRLKQLNEKGVDATLGSLLEEIRQRDERDSGRSVAPLKPAADAIVLDSTAMTIDEVCLHVTQAAEQRDIHSALNPA